MESEEEKRKVIERATIFRVGDERRMVEAVDWCLLDRCIYLKRGCCCAVLLKQLIMKESTAACSPTVSLLIILHY